MHVKEKSQYLSYIKIKLEETVYTNDNWYAGERDSYMLEKATDLKNQRLVNYSNTLSGAIL